jgi:AraC family transcriptional regulator
MHEWLPDSGFVCDEKPMMEMYHNNPEEHPERKFILDICVPVKPM